MGTEGVWALKLVAIVNGIRFDVNLTADPERENAFVAEIGGDRLPVEIVELKPTSITMGIGGSVGFFEYSRSHGTLREVIHSGKSYEVEVKTPRQVEMEELLNRFRRKGAGPSAEKQILAPMPGKLLDIYVKPGDKVEIGQVVGVLEAMKMENELGSTVEGKVKEVLVKKGDTVSINQVLIEFE